MSLNHAEVLFCREAMGQFFDGMGKPKNPQAQKERDQMAATFTAGWTVGYRKGLRRARELYEVRKAKAQIDAQIYEPPDAQV